MMNINYSGFDWDDGNREKCQKHGLRVIEIEQLFAGSTLHIAPDLKHSEMEQRYLAIGKSASDRPMFVVFTLRIIDGEMLIRPISGRFMHKREWDKYEQEFTDN